MDITKIQSAGYKITYIAQPGAHGPRVLWDGRSLIRPIKSYVTEHYGLSVWEAADAWLKQQANAADLAPYFNADPDMVCSLGLSVEGVTIPVRWLVTDGASFINTGVYPDANTGFEGDAIFTDVSNNYPAYSIVDKAVNNEAFGISWWSLLWHTWYGSNSQKNGGRINANVKYHIRQLKGDVRIEGEDSSVWTASNSGTPTIIHSEMFFPAARRNNNIPSTAAKGKFVNFIMYDGSTMIRNFIPCHDNTQGNGMLDLVNAVFYPNAGTGAFTIEEV